MHILHATSCVPRSFLEYLTIYYIIITFRKLFPSILVSVAVVYSMVSVLVKKKQMVRRIADLYSHFQNSVSKTF